MPAMRSLRKPGEKCDCLACHSVDKKIVGPACKDVATESKGDAGAEARLVAEVEERRLGRYGVRFRCRQIHPCQMQMSRLW